MLAERDLARQRYALGIASSIVSDAEVTAAAPADRDGAARFLIDTVLDDAGRLARFAQSLSIDAAAAHGFLTARRAGLPESQPAVKRRK